MYPHRERLDISHKEGLDIHRGTIISLILFDDCSITQQLDWAGIFFYTPAYLNLLSSHKLQYRPVQAFYWILSEFLILSFLASMSLDDPETLV